MVMPYQLWMLQRIEANNRPEVSLGDHDLSGLAALLDSRRVRKVGGRLFEDAAANGRTDA